MHPSSFLAATPVAPSAFSGDEVVRLTVDSIDHNPHQTRRMFHETELKELAESIRVQGVLQPIVVRPNGEGGFKLILGERRLRASRMAGIETIPAIVKRVSEQQAAEMTLVENLQRQDLNCLEQAEAFSNLSQTFGLTQEEIGQRVGMKRETVANYMRLLTLPESVLEALIGGRLTFSHARALMALKDPVEIWSLAKRAIEENLKVADLEKLVKGIDVPHTFSQSAPRGARWVDPNVRAAQRSLEEVLGMRVRIQDKQGRGKIVIEYGTIDDFERVVGMLRGR
jgi:ParB family transcriptional regulator, chromosome partitioning protein